MNVLSLFAGPVMACDWMSEGNQLVTASWDHTARLWDAQTGSTIHILRGGCGFIFKPHTNLSHTSQW